MRHPDSEIINASIEQKRSALMVQLTRAEMAGTPLGISKNAKQTMITSIRKVMEIHESENRAAVFNKLNVIGKNIINAWGRDVSLDDLNKEWVEKYIAHRFSKNMHINSIKKELSTLGSVLQYVEYEGKNYFRILNKKYKHLETNKEKLTADEIKLMEEVKLYGMDDLARDMFLFSFYTHGMRLENVVMFEVAAIRGNVLKYKMNKGKKYREIELHDKLNAILEKYKDNKPFLFPVLKQKPKDNWDKPQIIGSAGATINLRLKRVAVICGIETNLTMHIARHTFAYLSLKRGVNRNVLKDVLGHSSVKTTEKYLKELSDDDINDAVKGLYD